MGRIPALEAARGVAALMVVAVHVRTFHATDGVPEASYLDFTSRGWLGVQVFFVLSGLVLYLPYARGKRLHVPSYLSARFARIVPGLWVALPVAWLASGIWSDKAWRHLFFVNGWGSAGQSPDPPAWTLTIELGFYLLLPALIFAFARRPRYRVPILLGLIVTGLVMRQGLWSGWPRTSLSYVDNFATGMLCAILVARVQSRRWMLPAGFAAFAVAVCLPGMRQMTAVPLLVAAVLFAVTLGALATVQPRTPRPLVWLGTVSYGVYLWHWPILEITTRHGLYQLPDPLEIVVVAAVATTFGWLSWRLVEKPCLTLARGKRLAGRPDHASRQISTTV